MLLKTKRKNPSWLSWWRMNIFLLDNYCHLGNFDMMSSPSFSSIRWNSRMSLSLFYSFFHLLFFALSFRTILDTRVSFVIWQLLSLPHSTLSQKVERSWSTSKEGLLTFHHFSTACEDWSRHKWSYYTALLSALYPQPQQRRQRWSSRRASVVAYVADWMSISMSTQSENSERKQQEIITKHAVFCDQTCPPHVVKSHKWRGFFLLDTDLDIVHWVECPSEIHCWSYARGIRRRRRRRFVRERETRRSESWSWRLFDLGNCERFFFSWDSQKKPALCVDRLALRTLLNVLQSCAKIRTRWFFMTSADIYREQRLISTWNGIESDEKDVQRRTKEEVYSEYYRHSRSWKKKNWFEIFIFKFNHIF